MGAMVFGNVHRERLQLNESTLWSGYPDAGNNPEGPALLPQVRKAMSEGDYLLATALWSKMQGPYSARYLPMGDLFLEFDHNNTPSPIIIGSLILPQRSLWSGIP
ncbi:glycoside hydrolase N-terminal domain-containing protein [Pedobacter sp. HDW13]|uniref:glycoside hydrolase N-terminal domain-containing protein n=1 Tax=Pedobacter sp. HDW13 TaxID=2714940 RepID=UPI0021069885|nr:glycoside hydrolase N-terminal domain-containing protein [Pedobacter sp. HDW13]